MKKNSLPIEDSLLPIICIGIASLENDYRLCHFLNKELDLNLSKRLEKLVLESREQAVEISYFYSEDAYAAWYLFENRIDSIPLLPDYKTINYWFIMKHKTVLPLKVNLPVILNKMDVIVTSFELKNQKEIQFLNNLIIQ